MLLTIFLIPWLAVVGEWVEISQSHYRKPLKPYTVTTPKVSTKETVYYNQSLERQWSKEVFKLPKEVNNRQPTRSNYEDKVTSFESYNEESFEEIPKNERDSTKIMHTTEEATYKYSERPIDFFNSLHVNDNRRKVSTSTEKIKQRVTATTERSVRINRTRTRSPDQRITHKGFVVKIGKDEVKKTLSQVNDKKQTSSELTAHRKNGQSSQEDDTENSTEKIKEMSNKSKPTRTRYVGKVESVKKPGTDIVKVEPQRNKKGSDSKNTEVVTKWYESDISGSTEVIFIQKETTKSTKAKLSTNHTDSKSVSEITVSTPMVEDISSTEIHPKKTYRPNRIYLQDVTPSNNRYDLSGHLIDDVVMYTEAPNHSSTDTTTDDVDDDVVIETVEEEHVIRNDKIPFDRTEIVKLSVPEEDPGFVTKHEVLETVGHTESDDTQNVDENIYVEQEEEEEQEVDHDASVIEEASEQLSNSTKPNPMENILKVMKIVSETISRNSQSFKSKVKYLKQLRDSIMSNIVSRIDALWPDDRATGGRAGRSARSHVEFPSSESALMTISFLTFAVFLIKLVLQVILTYKNKTMLATPVFAVSRAAAAAFRDASSP